MNTRKVFLILLIPFFNVILQAQSVSLADFSLETTGLIPEGKSIPLFFSSGTIAGRFVPVSWLRFQAQASLEIPDTAHFFHPLPESNESGTLSFDGASLLFPSVFHSPLNVSVFSGYYDDPASLSLLRDLLKVHIPAPEFFSKPAGKVFSTEKRITGTGIAMTSLPGNRNMAAGMYGYWNLKTNSDALSSFDLRFGSVTDSLQFNAFTGISFEMLNSTATMRGGLTAIFDSGSGNILYAEMGIRRYSFGASDNDRNLYLLFEPRIQWGKADFAFSFFSSPVFVTGSSDRVTAGGTYLGMNLLAGFGNLRADKMRGGISLLTSLNPENPGTITPFSFSISPFYSMLLSDFLFEVTTVIKPLLYNDPYSMAEVMISFKAVY